MMSKSSPSGFITTTGGWLIAGLLAFPLLANADALTRSLARCVAEPDNSERLACFDAATANLNGPAYEGKRNFESEVFTLDQPHKLTFESKGVIFVLYVMDGAGNVIQNLHVGGAGQGDYQIESPGDYQLRVNASNRWAIWLEPNE